MKKQFFPYKLQRPNSRVHFMLFSNNSPFKQKVVERKDLYKRKPKHKNTDLDQ